MVLPFLVLWSSADLEGRKGWKFLSDMGYNSSACVTLARSVYCQTLWAAGGQPLSP